MIVETATPEAGSALLEESCGAGGAGAVRWRGVWAEPRVRARAVTHVENASVTVGAYQVLQ